MTSLTWLRWLSVAAFIGAAGVVSAQQPSGKFRALVITPERYSAPLRSLPKPLAGGQRMKAALEAFAKSLGYIDYKVEVLPDSDEARRSIGVAADSVVVLDAIDALTREASGTQDTMVVHFLGHGATAGGDVVLFVDGSAGPSFGSRRISLAQSILSPAWNSSKARVKLVFLDACRVFVQTADSLGPTGVISVDSLVARPDDSTEVGTAIFFGAGSGAYGYVNEKVGYGFFTEALAELLLTSVPESAEELNTQLREMVSLRVKQTLGPGFIQLPVMKTWLTSGVGPYRLGRSSTAAAAQPSTPASVPTAITQKPTASQESGFVRLDGIIYDKRSGLAWVRDLNALGSTMEAFSSHKAGNSSLEADVRALKRRADKLVVDGIAGWRLATMDEVRLLEEMQPASVFLNFARSKGNKRDAVGLVASEGDRVRLWGMQYGNYLRGPTDWGWGDVTLNAYGVWLVKGPMKLDNEAAGRPIVAVREARSEVELRPMLARTLVKTSSGAYVPEPATTQLTVGNLREERIAIAEYSIRRLQGAAIIRAELIMQGQHGSGKDISVDMEAYIGNGDDIELPVTSPSGSERAWTPRWFFLSAGRVEVPQREVLAAAASQGTLGIRFKYSAELGNASFALPSLVVTYVPQNSRLSRLPEFARID